MGSLYRHGQIWWAKYYRNGRPIRESTRTTRETEAKRFLKLRVKAGERWTLRPLMCNDILYNARPMIQAVRQSIVS
jgi:hypothetical protein